MTTLDNIRFGLFLVGSTLILPGVISLINFQYIFKRIRKVLRRSIKNVLRKAYYFLAYKL